MTASMITRIKAAATVAPRPQGAHSIATLGPTPEVSTMILPRLPPVRAPW